jgi:DNA-directed RNA polymerase subunit RPC12/RpoP
MLTDAETKKILLTWSREVQLLQTEVGMTIFRCVCGLDYQQTVGRLDRVRCPKCNSLYHVEV